MSSKSKLHPKLHGLPTVHTAGIFSDMTVDGPEIGTLVVVVDRAKNLPDRKSIGKQNPYCAARLGKEAKKTETDHRGGQTPKWDQELRYTVHDSPDYYLLKVSVFNDDKKTDLIGETKIDLKDIIVPGGGQNDLWHSLNCKGKYAGEIRALITYHDTHRGREKPRKSIPFTDFSLVTSTNHSSNSFLPLKTPDQVSKALSAYTIQPNTDTEYFLTSRGLYKKEYQASSSSDCFKNPPRSLNEKISSLEISTASNYIQKHDRAPKKNASKVSLEYSTTAPTPISHHPPKSPYDVLKSRSRQTESRQNFYQDHYSPRKNFFNTPYNFPSAEELGPPPSLSDCPPPPPIHRSGNTRNQVSLGQTSTLITPPSNLSHCQVSHKYSQVGCISHQNGPLIYNSPRASQKTNQNISHQAYSPKQNYGKKSVLTK